MGNSNLSIYKRYFAAYLCNIKNIKNNPLSLDRIKF